ncbi:hypothetical protein ACOMHN_061731 [Nucella lapillus]
MLSSYSTSPWTPYCPDGHGDASEQLSQVWRSMAVFREDTPHRPLLCDRVCLSRCRSGFAAGGGIMSGSAERTLTGRFTQM